MGKTGQPPWAKRILKLLEQAKAKDPDFERFGAYSHQYRLAAPASEEQILKFEEQQGIRLPEDLKGKEEVLDYFLEYLSTEEEPDILIYAVWCTEGVEDQQLQELFVKLMDKYRTHENARFDYKGSQMVLKGGACMGASRPEGQLTSNLMWQFDYFGLDYRGAWKLLMDDGRWREWKGQNGFL